MLPVIVSIFGKYQVNKFSPYNNQYIFYSQKDPPFPAQCFIKNVCNYCIRTFSVECAFQSSKVFEKGGPYTDLLDKSSREAKRDPRLRDSGKLIAFHCFNMEFPLEPKDYFYNWLYINALNLNKELANKIINYDSFSDIEFNPHKSINCQAKAAAIYVGLSKQDLLNEALESCENFLEIVYCSCPFVQPE